MRLVIFILLIVCLGCSKSDDKLASQRRADIAQFEGQIINIDAQIANETRLIDNDQKQTIVVRDSNQNISDKIINSAIDEALRPINNNGKQNAKIGQLKSQREIIMGKLMILYQLEQSSRK